MQSWAKEITKLPVKPDYEKANSLLIELNEMALLKECDKSE